MCSCALKKLLTHPLGREAGLVAGYWAPFKVCGLFWLPLLVSSVRSAHYQERQRIQYQYEVFITSKANGH